MAISLSPGLRARVRVGSVPIALQLAALIAIHVLLWTWVGVSSRSNFDTPGDMVETYVWGQGWQWGYFKHPPLSAWVAAMWFKLCPESHLGFSMLTALNSGLGLAGLAFLAREFVPSRWVLLVVAVASLAPGVTTLAMRFNANSILIATWPWAMALFVRLMQRGRTRDAVLCGVACAAAVLGKYYSVVLLISLLSTALCLPAWRARVASLPMAVAVLSFLACLWPHGLWLLAQTHGPLQYAHEATGQQSPGTSAMRALTFALTQCVFPLLAFLALRLALAGSLRHRAFWHAVVAPLWPRAQAPWLLAMLPILATMAGTVLTGARTATVWGLAIAAGLALLAVMRAREAGATLNLRALWRTLFVIWAAVAVLAPLWWQARAVLKTPSVVEPRQELALALQRAWRVEHAHALPWVTGTRALAASTAFYAPDHPGYWSLWAPAIETPWVDTVDMRSRGGVIVCEPVDSECQSMAEFWSADRRELAVAKRARGFQFEPRHYVYYVVHPVVAEELP